LPNQVLWLVLLAAKLDFGLPGSALWDGPACIATRLVESGFRAPSMTVPLEPPDSAANSFAAESLISEIEKD
jgi:hypothetical protein